MWGGGGGAAGGGGEGAGGRMKDRDDGRGVGKTGLMAIP